MAVFGITEFLKHRKRILSIPVRIHINGTRGKSSVTRLIGAGLRAGGLKTVTKVTGTYPRLILEDGSESEIYRKSDANIIEQKSIIKYAADRKVDALVIECMALEPLYQWITENQMIHATIGIITNIRPDHLDIMGPTVNDVGKALCNTIPKNGFLFTSEQEMTGILKKKATRNNTELYIVNSDTVTDEELKGFSYIEHRDNVALALAICKHLGIDRQIALNAMFKATPDEGVLKSFNINQDGKKIKFFNALAANDPQSTYMIWEKIERWNMLEGNKCIMLNTRLDRLDRSRQLTDMIGDNLSNKIDYLFLIGQGSNFVRGMAARSGIDPMKIKTIGMTTPEDAYNRITGILPGDSTIVAIGNMGVMGGKTSDYFQYQSEEKNS
jgi:poly-gamma-glutamate synthase PgsB/CapB